MVKFLYFREWFVFLEVKSANDISLELLNNNQNTLNTLKISLPQDMREQDKPKFLKIFAYFYKQQNNLNILKKDIQDYYELTKTHKLPIINIQDNLEPDLQEYKTYLKWTEKVHALSSYDNYIKSTKNVSNEEFKPIAQSPDGKIKVYEAHGRDKCISLGKGHSFCISRPANTMWQSYRDAQGSSFYFVKDSTRNDRLSTVVIDMQESGVKLTDVANHTGIIQDVNDPKKLADNFDSYFKYLESHGINISIFKHITKTQTEKDEFAKLGKQNGSLEWFKSLTTEEKSKYIGRGQELSDDQFDYLFENKFWYLLEQYVSSGMKLQYNQMGKVLANKELKQKYLHNRIIAISEGSDLAEEELFAMNDNQQKEVINKLDDENLSALLYHSKNKNYTIKIILDKKEDFNGTNLKDLLINSNDPVETAKSFGRYYFNMLSDTDVINMLKESYNPYKILEVLYGNKVRIVFSQIERAFMNTNGENQYDIIKFYVDNLDKKYIDISKDQYYDDELNSLIRAARYNTIPEIAKYLIEKSKTYIISRNYLHRFIKELNDTKIPFIKSYIKDTKNLTNDIARLLYVDSDESEEIKNLLTDKLKETSDKAMHTKPFI